MEDQLAAIARKRAILASCAPGMLGNFEHVQDIELTFTSNAIEGNTLTAVETMVVIEQGITVAGKPLRDHLEAIDHFEALGYVRSLARRTGALTEMDLRNLHRLVMLRSGPEIAGRYADQGRYVLTDAGRHAFPPPAVVPVLMQEFVGWLGTELASPAVAFAAHRRMVSIHPFNDGNGRKARLLMNLILLRAGYPPIAVRPQDRLLYLAALQAESADGAFERLLYERLDATLDEYLIAAGAAL